MRPHTRFTVILFIVLLAGSVFYLLFKRNASSPLREANVMTIHRYGDPTKHIGAVTMKLFYVVPKDRQGAAYTSHQWGELKNNIVRALDAVTRFHDVQFHHHSSLTYDIYPEPVFLERESDWYDWQNAIQTNNPRALLIVSQEIERRAFTPDGDLYQETFVRRDQSSYPVLGIVYEGVGANGGSIYDSDLGTSEEIAECFGIPVEAIQIVDISSSDGFFLISREYLTGSTYKESGASLLYHELGHTLGLPDRYTDDVTELDTVTSGCVREGQKAQKITGGKTNDIMGMGTFRPLEINYIDESLLREMGVEK